MKGSVMRKQQEVYESKTQSGIRGLFTNGRLVCHLGVCEDPMLKAQRHGFKFLPHRPKAAPVTIDGKVYE